MHRTYVAVALLLLAGGLSTPALVGPMLNRAPEPKLEAPEPSKTVARSTLAAGERPIPQFGRDIASRALAATPQLDGAELAQALATPVVPEAFNGNANANGGVGGGTGWAATRRNSNNGGGSDSRVFAGGGVGSATPGLLGWGLRDSRRAEAVQRTTPPAPRQNRPTDSGQSGGSSDGGSQQAAPAATPVVATGILGGAVTAGAQGSGSMPAGTPEPATLLLVSSGAAFAGLYGARRRRS